MNLNYETVRDMEIQIYNLDQRLKAVEGMLEQSQQAPPAPGKRR